MVIVSTDAFLAPSSSRSFIPPSRRKRSTLHQSTIDATEILVSPVMQVFIEDTDAYGIVYNGNYLRFYERALQGFAPASSILEKNDPWTIVRVNKHRFKQSPVLGDSFIVTGTKLPSDTIGEETWDLVMKSPTDVNVIYNTAVVTVATKLLTMPSYLQSNIVSSIDFDFMVYRDEFDSQVLPLRSVLNPFERVRSNILGGPKALQQLKDEQGVVFVVASVDDALLYASPCKPGETVIVRTTLSMARRGMLFKFQHILESNGLCVAKANIDLLTLDAATRKPTSKLPSWLLEKLAVV
jgi:acyl-CoA thioesterase FadM